MRIALLFGALLGVLQTIATLVIHACGLHSAPETLEGAQRFENIAAFVIMMACLSLGLRSTRRALLVQGRSFTFGAGARSTLIIAALGGLVAGLGQYLYVAKINPAYSDHFRAALLANAPLPLTPEQVAASQTQLDFITSALFRALNQSLTTFFFGLFIGFAYAFLFRDRAAATIAVAPAAGP